MKNVLILTLALAVSACSSVRPDGTPTLFGQARQGFRQAGEDIRRDFDALRRKAADAIRPAAVPAEEATATIRKSRKKPKHQI